jgi:release factor glutamine methyltransferase
VDVQRYRTALDRRIHGEPIQYLVGWTDFCGLRFRVTPAVLIPRPETEGLVEWVLAERVHAAAIADVGTGSGCLAASLAARRPDTWVCAIDQSVPALAVAADNARRLGVRGRVRFVAADLLGAFDGTAAFDVIVANPPYIPSSVIPTLPVEVRSWEPHQALDGGPDGMAVHRRLISQALDALRPGGWLVMEVGDGQARDVAERMAGAGFVGITIRVDLNGTERYVGGRRSPGPAGGRH